MNTDTLSEKAEGTNWGEMPMILTTDDVAKILRCSTTSVRKMCARKQIPHIRQGAILRIPKECSGNMWKIMQEKTHIQEL